MSIERKIIKSPNAPSAIGPYNQAIQVGNTLYLSGSIGMNPSTGNLVEGGIEAETRQCLTNIGNVLREAGLTYNNVVKTTVLLADINDFATLNRIYAEYFTTNYPARSTYQVAALPKGARVEIESIAICGDLVDVPSKI
jgi:2-iminobutanoate/2-iminopropanoate deaminase